MPGLTTKKMSNKKTHSSVTQMVAHRSQTKQKKSVPMMTASVVPAGTYRSRVASIADAECASGDAAIDVVYQLTDSTGKVVQARVRYPMEGYHLAQFVDAMMDAGLEDGAGLCDAVGLEENLTIVYPFTGSLGKIKSRSPAVAAVQSAPEKTVPAKSGRPLPHMLTDDDGDDELVDDQEDDPDEFDDFLEEDIDD